MTGLDLSPHYLAVARRELAAWSRTRLVEGRAEAMPFTDGEFTVVTSDLPLPRIAAANSPGGVRRNSARAEAGRNLDPGRFTANR